MKMKSISWDSFSLPNKVLEASEVQKKRKKFEAKLKSLAFVLNDYLWKSKKMRIRTK